MTITMTSDAMTSRTMTSRTMTNGAAASAAPTDVLGAELGATTAAGAEMVATAERLAGEFAAGALAHDRDGTFAAEHLERLRDDGFLVAPVARWLGGGGVDSVHDVLVAMSRLARGDASTTIGVNMHFAVLLNVIRRWRIALARGEDDQAAELGATLRMVADARIVFATAVSEPAPQDLTRPGHATPSGSRAAGASPAARSSPRWPRRPPS